MSKNRGMMLEGLINKTIKLYKKKGVALFHKKEVPVKLQKIANKDGKLSIEKATITSKSTADYYGLHNGVFHAFEAKSTKLKSLPLSNIKDHQLDYLNEVAKHGGKAYFIVFFHMFSEYYLIYPETIESLKRKSLSIDVARQEGIPLELMFPGILDWIHKIK